MKFNDVATYWEATGARDRYGEPVYAAPVCVKVRWEESTKLFIDAATGEEAVSTARIFCKGVPKLESYFVRGSHNEVNPKDAQGSQRIRMVDNTPNHNGRKRIISAWL